MTPRTPRKVWFTQVGKDIVPNPQPCTEHDTEYHRADLSADLVRAALERAAQWLEQSIPHDAHPDSILVYAIKDRANLLRSTSPEAVAAIITSVLGEPT